MKYNEFHMAVALFSATALVLLCSCSKGIKEEAAAEPSGDVLVCTAGVTAPVTRVDFGALSAGVRPLTWSATGEAVWVGEFKDGVYSQHIASTGYEVDALDASKAVFQYSLKADAEAATYDYAVIYPAVRSFSTQFTDENHKGKISYGMDASVVQRPTASGPDSDCMVLTAVSSGHSSQQGHVDLSFEHQTAYGRMTFKNFPALEGGETLDLVTVTTPSGKNLTGRRWHDISTGDWSTHSSNPFNYAKISGENLTPNTTSFDVWFSCFPVDLAVDEVLTITAKTSLNTYEAEITLKKAFSLTKGAVSAFTVDWSKYQNKVLNFDFSGSPLDGWPTANTSATHNCVYPINGVNYTFDLTATDAASDNYPYWKDDGTGLVLTRYRYIGLPSIEDYKLTKVIATSGSSSTSYVGIANHVEATAIRPDADGGHGYVTGGSLQKWNALTNYTYDLSGTSENTVYYLFGFTSAGSFIKALTLTYEKVEATDKHAAVRVGTFNLRMSSLDDGDNAWTNRRSRAMAAITGCDFDIFGMNECDATIMSSLTEDLGATYSFWFFSPYRQDGDPSGGRAQGIAYKTAEFDISDTHYFWPSDTPDVMSTNDTGNTGQSSYNRGACCAVFTHKASGVQLFFMVTHGFLNDDANEEFAHVYIDREQMYNPGGLPSIFVGDMNAEPSDPPSETWRTWWSDVYSTVSPSLRSGPEYTFNAYSTLSKRIDFIYVRGDATPLNYTCNDATYGGFAPSDHFPIWSDVTVSNPL